MAKAHAGRLRGVAFIAMALVIAFAWDVSYGLGYDHVAALRSMPFGLSYFAVPMALCALVALALRRRLSLGGPGNGLLAPALGSLLAPFIVFLPVLYFDCIVLGACIG